MTTITTPTRIPEAHPATVPGGFSRDREPVADTPRFRSPAPAAAGGPTVQFLAPATAEEEQATRRSSELGELAMHRLRHPFAVAADPTSRPAVKVVARVGGDVRNNTGLDLP